MTADRAQRARELADRYPVELRPNPNYEYALPEIDEDGYLVVDAGFLMLGLGLERKGRGHDRT